MFNFYQCVIKFQMSYTFSEPVGQLLSLDLSYGFSSKIMQCVFVFTVKNNVIYFQLSIADNIQNLTKQYMHIKSHDIITNLENHLINLKNIDELIITHDIITKIMTKYINLISQFHQFKPI